MQAISKVQHLIIIERYNVNELAVNEQNPNAKVFYKHLGFKVYKRVELDEQGNPYPILYMKLDNMLEYKKIIEIILQSMRFKEKVKFQLWRKNIWNMYTLL